MSLIDEIKQYLAHELGLVNELIINSVATKEELIYLISCHLTKAGGKRIRPILTILAAKSLIYKGDNHLKLATAIEFIHMATLLHDDVIDGSKMRRFLPTANSIWGAKASILVGDFLFSQAFKLIVSTNIIKALEVLSHASSVISEGEVAQLSRLETKQLISTEEYYQLITAKTAELFSAACEVGAVVTGEMEVAKIFKKFGLYLGIMFQISDDLLDYFANKNQSGKNLGDDFYEGKVTLPLIFLAKKLPASDHKILTDMLKASQRKESDFVWIKDKMLEYHIVELVRKELEQIRDQALALIKSVKFKDVQAGNYLLELVNFSIMRIDH